MQIKVTQNLALVDYQQALDFMEDYVNEIIHHDQAAMLWFLEHPPLYSAGISARDSDLLSNKLPVYKTPRGGKYTYHGPGQRIVYLMINLKKLFGHDPPDTRQYVYNLEEWLINSLNMLDIKAIRRPKEIGIWVRQADDSLAKIASIGIKLRQWISYHGVAINVNPDLNNFAGIVPCGIENCAVTSVQQLGKKIDILAFDKILLDCFCKQFKIGQND